MAATKFQITLPREKAAEWKRAAQRRGIPLAEWIRVTMDKELRGADSFQIRPPADWLTRMVNDEEQDPTVSSRIDQILYGE